MQMSEDVQRTLGRMEGKLDALLVQINEEKEHTEDHEERIGKLERWQSWTFGVSAAVGVVVGAFWKLYSTLPHGQ